MATKVLVFESDATFASELRTELGKLGCAVRVVDDGNLGLQQATTDPPELILLAIELPRMNGFSVCNKLKKDPTLKDVPLIILSSESSEDTFEQHRKLRTRAEDYVHKPIAFTDLLKHIESFVRLEGRSSGSDAPAVTDSGALPLDDEIALASAEMDDEGTLIVRRPLASDSPLSTRSLEALPADAGFGLLSNTPVPSAPVSVAPAAMANGVEQNGLRRPSARPPTVATHATQTSQTTQKAHLPSNPPFGNANAPLAPPPAAASRPLAPSPAREASGVPGVPVASGGDVPRRGLPTPIAPRRPTALENAELERLKAELERARARNAELTNELAETKGQAARAGDEARRGAEEESKRLQRDLDELKSKLAAVQKEGRPGGGVSSREFLDLREALNRKDKEILAQREHLTRKDREILDTSDRVLTFERAHAEIEDKLHAAERELEESKEQIGALAGVRDQAQTHNEELRGRLGRLQGDFDVRARELEARTRELGEVRARMQERLALVEAELASVRAETQQVLERERAERVVALEAAEQRRQNDAEAARRALEEARELNARERTDSLLARERELRQETDSKLAALHRAHQDELNRTRTELSRQIDAAGVRHAQELAVAEATRIELLETVQREAEERFTAWQTELEARRADEIQALTKDRDDRLGTLERELTARLEARAREHQDRVQTLEQDRDERLDRLRREADERVAIVQNDRDARVAEVEAKLIRELGELRASSDADKAAAQETIGGYERDLREVRAALSSMEEGRASEASASALRVAELEQALSHTKSLRKDAQEMFAESQRALGEARDRGVALEAELAALRAELGQTKSALDLEGARAKKAHAKWDSDKASLDRAKDALALALQQIEDAEQRAIE